MIMHPIYLALKEGNIALAFTELEAFPECNDELNKLIQKCIKEFGVPYGCWNDFHENIAWLVEISATHNVEPLFRSWLEHQETGLNIPKFYTDRVSVLTELMQEGVPLFEFKPEELSVEKRFLVDFGFATVKQPDAPQDATT